MRPVRFAPCAPGASPTINSFASAGPKPVMVYPNIPDLGKRVVL